MMGGDLIFKSLLSRTTIWRSEICLLIYYCFYLTCGFILFWHILRMLIVFSPSLFFVKIWKFHDTLLVVISLLPNVEGKVSPFWKACLIRITKKSPGSQNGDFPPFSFFIYKNLSKKWVFFTTLQILASLVVATIFLCCKYLENIRNYRKLEVLSLPKWAGLSF